VGREHGDAQPDARRGLIALIIGLPLDLAGRDRVSAVLDPRRDADHADTVVPDPGDRALHRRGAVHGRDPDYAIPAVRSPLGSAAWNRRRWRPLAPGSTNRVLTKIQIPPPGGPSASGSTRDHAGPVDGRDHRPDRRPRPGRNLTVALSKVNVGAAFEAASRS
jgi:hypothetical protein